MVLHRRAQLIESHPFHALPSFLAPGDLLVLNNSRVIPARLRGRKLPTAGEVEILLLEPRSRNQWEAMTRPAKRLRPGTRVQLGPDSDPAEIVIREKLDAGLAIVEFPPDVDPLAFADRHGEMPLPPYIAREQLLPSDRQRYQTVYAREPGSVAAPTAGLHFSESLLQTLRAGGIETCEVTLHVGLGTFAPVKAATPEEHVMHSERYELPEATVNAIQKARAAGRRVVAVGTTSLRVLESVARAHGGTLEAGGGRTDLFLYPPADFHVVDALLTNFHLPRSTLLMLVSAFAKPGALEGRDFVLRAYREAISQRFRFFSYGDAMLLV